MGEGNFLWRQWLKLNDKIKCEDPKATHNGGKKTPLRWKFYSGCQNNNSAWHEDTTRLKLTRRLLAQWHTESEKHQWRDSNVQQMTVCTTKYRANRPMRRGGTCAESSFRICIYRAIVTIVIIIWNLSLAAAAAADILISNKTCFFSLTTFKKKKIASSRLKLKMKSYASLYHLGKISSNEITKFWRLLIIFNSTTLVSTLEIKNKRPESNYEKWLPSVLHLQLVNHRSLPPSSPRNYQPRHSLEIKRFHITWPWIHRFTACMRNNLSMSNPRKTHENNIYTHTTFFFMHHEQGTNISDYSWLSFWGT